MNNTKREASPSAIGTSGSSFGPGQLRGEAPGSRRLPDTADSEERDSPTVPKQDEGKGKGQWKRKRQGGKYGGRSEIRTHGTLTSSPVFKTGALNHSAILPARAFFNLSRHRLAASDADSAPT